MLFICKKMYSICVSISSRGLIGLSINLDNIKINLSYTINFKLIEYLSRTTMK